MLNDTHSAALVHEEKALCKEFILSPMMYFDGQRYELVNNQSGSEAASMA